MEDKDLVWVPKELAEKIKDDFKEALLNEVGLSIQYYTYADVVGD